MALYTILSGAVALSAVATKSLWLLNPVTKKLKVVEIGVSFDGASPAAGIGCVLYRVTTLGTPAGTSLTPRLFDPDEAAATTTALINLTTEPTTKETLNHFFVSPYSGLAVVQYPLGREPIADAAGNRIGLHVVTPAGVNPNGSAYVYFEE